MPTLAETDQETQIASPSYSLSPEQIWQLEHFDALENESQPASMGSGYGYSLQLLRVGLPVWLTDMTVICLSLFLGLVVASLVGKQTNHFLAFCSGSLGVYSLCLWSAGVYPGVGVHPARELRQLFRCLVTSTLVIALAVLMLANWRSPYFLMVGVAFVAQLFLFPLGRSLVKGQMRKFGVGVPFYFLGSQDAVQRVCHDMSRFGWTMLKPVGRFSPDPTEEFRGHAPVTSGNKGNNEVAYLADGTELLGSPDELVNKAREKQVHWLFVVGEAPRIETSHRLNGICQAFSEVVWVRPDRSEACAGSSILSCGLASGVRVEESLRRPMPRFQKRLMDVLIAGSFLIVLAPFFCLIAFLVRLSGAGPILYGSTRIGRSGEEFKAWKFRSMVANAKEVLTDYLDANPELQAEWNRNHKLQDDPRITRIGRILRKTSLDELPQLWNVLVGEMSLVGPRPILPDELEKFGTALPDYLRVRPGITGLWQVSGRNKTHYSERLVFASFYVRHWTPWLDMYILMRTIRTVLFCEGAY